MKVLIADDDPISLLYLQEAVRDWGYAVVTARDGIAASRLLLDKSPPDLALLDWMMPGKDGVDICRAVRDAQGARYTYLALLSSGGESEKTALALAAGADDFLSKPVDPERLEKALAMAKRIVQLENRLREAGPYDREAAMHGRTAILGLLQTELRRSERTRKPVSAMLYAAVPARAEADGRTAVPVPGSATLRETGLRMRRILRPYDMLGRVDADRVLIVLPDCDAVGALDVADRALAEMTRSQPGSRSGPAKISLYIAAATAQGPEDAAQGASEGEVGLFRRLATALDAASRETPGIVYRG